MDHHHLVHVHQMGDGREVAQRVVRQGAEQVGVGGDGVVRRQQQGAAVGRGAHHCVGARDSGAAGAVLHHHRLAPGALQILGDRARQQIEPAAGREGNDDGDPACREGALRAGDEGRGEAAERGGEDGAAADHAVSPG